MFRSSFDKNLGKWRITNGSKIGWKIMQQKWLIDKAMQKKYNKRGEWTWNAINML